MISEDRIYVAGHNGMVGSAICRKLKADGYTNLILRSSKELDLRNQEAVEGFFASERPNIVFLAAAKVGGIVANNTYRADFLYDNLMIEANVIHNAYRHGVRKLLFLGSSCIYPKFAEQPIKEESLLSGYLEPTNEPYAIAKIAGIKLCESYREQYGADFISAMPTNLYGPGDNYDLNNSHVLPAMIRKFHEAKENSHSPVTLWGDGSPMREFLHTDDLAEALVFLMENYSEKQLINVGYGSDVTIKELAELIQKTVGHEGEVQWDSSKPNGTPKKLMDSSRIQNLRWSPKIALVKGISSLYKDYKASLD
jgi:GDP-L-fucose synthase